MHSERVNRHSKGMTQVLSDLKQRFTQMNTEHNKLAEKFRSDIEGMESVFVSSTKSAKWVKALITWNILTYKPTLHISQPSS